MRARVVRAAQLAVLPTVGLGAVLALLPDRAELAVHVWLLAMVALALGVAVATVHGAYPDVPSQFDAPGGGSGGPPPLHGLDRAEREVALSMSSAFDAHLRLRPALREVAVGLLATRRGIDLERRPDRARQLLGEELWELVRPDREPPGRRHDGGLSVGEVDRMLRTLDEL